MSTDLEAAYNIKGELLRTYIYPASRRLN